MGITPIVYSFTSNGYLDCFCVVFNWMSILPIVHLFINNGHLDCFWVWTILNKIPTNLQVHASVRHFPHGKCVFDCMCSFLLCYSHWIIFDWSISKFMGTFLSLVHSAVNLSPCSKFFISEIIAFIFGIDTCFLFIVSVSLKRLPISLLKFACIENRSYFTLLWVVIIAALKSLSVSSNIWFISELCLIHSSHENMCFLLVLPLQVILHC